MVVLTPMSKVLTELPVWGTASEFNPRANLLALQMQLFEMVSNSMVILPEDKNLQSFQIINSSPEE